MLCAAIASSLVLSLQRSFAMWPLIRLTSERVAWFLTKLQ